MNPSPSAFRVAIACGGTGGHLFPGLAVAEKLYALGCPVTLLISPKEVDRQAIQLAGLAGNGTRAELGLSVVTLPSVALQGAKVWDFLRGFVRSYRLAWRLFVRGSCACPPFHEPPPHPALSPRGGERGVSPGEGDWVVGPDARPKLEVEAPHERLFLSPHSPPNLNGGTVRLPAAVLGMGGFTSAPPLLAAWRQGVAAFLHESNTVPGRANRWLSWIVREAFVGFPETAPRLRARRVTVTGTPVRSQFRPADARACRVALGFDPERPVVLVMGGSQGARGLNELVIRALPLVARRLPDTQWMHLAGQADVAKVAQAYAAAGLKAQVHAFWAAMEKALGAATVAVSRAGASALAELAALRVPAVLVPFPAATGQHQLHNARAFAQTGAARLLEQASATPERLAEMLWDYLANPALRETTQTALARWHNPHAAAMIADTILRVVADRQCQQSAPAARPGASRIHCHSSATS